MIKSDGKNQRHYKKYDQYALVFRAKYQQTEETDQQNREFRRDDIGKNCAHEKAFFAFEERHADRAMVADFEGLREDFGLSTRRAVQP